MVKSGIRVCRKKSLLKGDGMTGKFRKAGVMQHFGGQKEMRDSDSRINKSKNSRLDFTLLRRVVCVEPPKICNAYFIQWRTKPLYRANKWGGEVV